MGSTLAGDNYEAANNMQLAGMNAIGNVYQHIPKISQMKVKLADLVQQGVLDPEMAQTFLQEATAYASMDPTARNEMMDTVESKGFDPQSRSALNDLQQEIGAQERGSREAIIQDAAARGISGSGIELASQMANQQGNATRLANQGFQSAADANARHMQAVQGLYNMDAQKAAAQDTINQFNAANRQSVENMNVGTRNAAAASNLAEKQRIADQNVMTKNQQELYNKGLYQQDFQNRLNQANAFATGGQSAAGTQMQQAENKTAMANKWSDENLKTDIEPVNPEEFLDNLTGYSYEYKDGEGMEEGPQVGVMAQDIEKSAPQAVEDTPEGKMVDYSKMGGPILAALASLNKRIDDLEGEENG